MSTADSTAFDLIDQPWLLATELDGTVVEVSLRDALVRAHELAGLFGEIPTQVFALTRLLLAVLQRALDGPLSTDDWAQHWESPALPVVAIDAYLESYRHRFDLLHPETPFFQVAGLRTGKGEVSELTKLIADVPNGKPFLTTRVGSGVSSLSLAEAARWVVHCQAFDASGIKSGAVGDPRVKGGKGYPIGVAWSGHLGGVLVAGATLRETLLLNLVGADAPGGEHRTGDVPAWERSPLGSAEEVDGGRAPLGPLDLMTWQSRRIRLATTGEAVTGVVIANGDKLTPQNQQPVEDHTAWRRSQAQEKSRGEPLVYMSREHDPDRAIWRNLQALLPGVVAGTSSEPARTLAPRVLEWIAHLQFDNVLPSDFPLRVRTIGMVYGSQSSVIVDVVDDAVAVRATVVGAADLAVVASSSARAAEAAARALGNLAGNLAAAAGGDPAGAHDRATEQAYAELDAPYRAWLADLGAADTQTDATIRWHRSADAVVRHLGQVLVGDAPMAAWVGREARGRLVTSGLADRWFQKELRTALPQARQPTTDEESA